MRRVLIGVLLVAACGSSKSSGTVDGPLYGGGDGPGSGSGTIDAPLSDAPGTIRRTVFVIPMENEPSSAIYGNTTNAPYINSLMPQAAYAMKFQDELPALPSEPHYVWMEAGTNQFNDVTFTTDIDPSASHSTSRSRCSRPSWGRSG